MSFAASLFGAFGPSHSFSNEDHWFFSSVAQPTFAGRDVSEHGALALTSVYAAVGILSDVVAQLPIDVLRKVGKRHEPQGDHPAAVLLNRSANPYMTAFTMRNTAQSHVLLWGNGYLEVQRDRGGSPAGLWPMLPDRTRRETGKEGGGYRTSIDGKEERIRAASVAHIPALGFDGLQGYSPIWVARQAIGLGLALEEYGARFFSNDAKSGGFLKHPGRLGDEARKNLQESMQGQGGLSNAHRLKILEEGMEFQAMTIPPEDAQFLSTRTFQTEEIARIYRIPLHMLQSHTKSTAWGTGLSEMSLGFVQYTLAPWLVRWEQEMNRKLLTPQEVQGGFYIRHNVNALLRGDSKNRADFYTKALDPETGWMKREEVRALEDLNPLEDGEWPDVPTMPARPEPRPPAE